MVGALAAVAEALDARVPEGEERGHPADPCPEVLDDHPDGDPFREPGVHTTPPGGSPGPLRPGCVVARADCWYAAPGRPDDGPLRPEGP
ncbi:hypothetical protein [Streptomyces sp. NPDC086122]|uniref:hypothetical protein n=1 Tax=Streptomyces sp. NPDC086122 TaxID=3155294 RepID=UPI003436A813